MGFYHNNMSRLHKYSSRLVYGDIGGGIASICLNLSRFGQLIIRHYRDYSWPGYLPDALPVISVLPGAALPTKGGGGS